MNCRSKVSACLLCHPKGSLFTSVVLEGTRDGSTGAGDKGEEAVRAAASGRGTGQLQTGAEARPDRLHLPRPAGDHSPGMTGFTHHLR